MSLEAEILEAEAKALESLAKYKFMMFGYWAGIWVHLNRIEGQKRPNPFKMLVQTARDMQRFSTAYPAPDQPPLNLEDRKP